MAGVFIGGLLCGHLSDAIGRKPTYFGSIAVLGFANFIAYFSVSWQMFAAVRFVIGLGCGGYVSVYFIFASEYVVDKWRSLLAAIPSWTLYAALLALVAWLVPDWKYLHLATSLSAIPFMFTWW